MATVTAEFEVDRREQAVEIAEELFGHREVLTVRVGGPGERSVYRVDVPREDDAARGLASRPAERAADRLGVTVRFVRIGITADGLGDPEGEPPVAVDLLPWAGRRTGTGRGTRAR
ncbi:hypothetical protein [Nocardioides hwasunensis]|uniref:Uncharacterized protein n=1 Tax=Nocardioides hwasunensis TaxID=397258 RepID=A0ABR8MM02_9ACTN|nr:hypothetical protein [Nocardioides hwasunensis]MBD3917049.1 hypothetical protein [Nocardioides hwasunensis]